MSVHNTRAASYHLCPWLMIATVVTAGAILIFEIIPMTIIPTVNFIIKQQEEHIIYSPTSSKTEDEHIIAVISYALVLVRSDWKSTTLKDEKLQHLTFRTPEGIIKALKKEANSKGVPLSILLNQILKNHLIQRESEKTNFVLSSKDFFRRIFEKIDQKSLEDYGEELGRAIVSEYTSSYFPDINACTIVQFLESWFGRFPSYQHRVDEVNNRHSFSLNHDINMNFSIVLRVILEGLVEPVINNKLILGELTSTSITFTFDV